MMNRVTGMSKTPGPIDAQARESALNPETSFIVQAPAGSGKTGLLTQRYLRLLACVDHPEEITAITFTRKAASEMRDRILQALMSARNNHEPDSTHDRLTIQLARLALERDQQIGWGLLDSPARMRIQTIDSLSLELARQMPLLSGFGVMPGITDDASTLYREAAQAMLLELEAGNELSDALVLLLRHLDNQMGKLQDLIANMLERRDHWLRHVVDPEHPRLQRAEIEDVLSCIVVQSMKDLQLVLPQEFIEKLPALARFAASNLPEQHRLYCCRDMQKIPGTLVADLEQWLALCSLLLIKGGEWRKKKGVTKSIGFPTEKDAPDEQLKGVYKQMKQDMQVLLESVQDNNELQNNLAALTSLPASAYSDTEWQVIDALFRILLRSATHLTLVFSEHGKVDFAEMALRAKQALGDEHNPTNLALRLDYQIRHLLVDEFQDTSLNQSELFRRLTAGWEKGDGRTLFLVGDPMQSIYRFREAEVGLFIDAWQGSLGDIELTPLSLSVNFRSQQGVIDWVNESFPKILPSRSDKVLGAVSYAPSSTYKPLETGPAVTVHPYIEKDDQAEAQQIIDLIRNARKQNASDTIAVLVRNRSHLTEIINQLKNNNLAYKAVEIDHLAQRPVIQDLLSLTCALIQAADRIHWLALLHAPFCGLLLSDLHALTGDNQLDFDSTVIDLLHEATHIERMSSAGQHHVKRFLPVLDAALMQRDRRPLRAWVEGVWITLGGPATVLNDTDLEDTEVFFQLLEQLYETGEVIEPQAVLEKVIKLFALADINADNTLQLMTIHKAKGLEFDTVIMPGLGKIPRGDDARLLYWLERTGTDGLPELVFAPIKSASEEINQTASYIKALESNKGGYENGRLLYVGVTRAKKYLHLMGHATFTIKSGVSARKGSMLEQLWPRVKETFVQAYDKIDSQEDRKPEQELPQPVASVFRLSTNWIRPEPPTGIQVNGVVAEPADQDIEFDWAGESARIIGIVVHRLLQQLALSTIAPGKIKDCSGYKTVAKQMLLYNGIPEAGIETSLERVLRALNNCVTDERGQWILFEQHQDAHCEYPVSAVAGSHIQHMIIDRTFIDQQGTRWVIDYKTGSHEGGNLDQFLDREQDRYYEQLERYARTMQQLDQHPVRRGLYFPMNNAWREW